MERDPTTESVVTAQLSDAISLLDNQPLCLDSKTFKEYSEVDYKEPGILWGGRVAARCSIKPDADPEELNAMVSVPLPGAARRWLGSHLLHNNDPTVYISVDSWPVEAPSAAEGPLH